MSDPDQKFKKAIAEFLELKKLCVSEIPCATTKTPDLLVEEGTPDATLIEIKQKTHDQKELDKYFAEMERNGIASRSRPTGYRNRLDGIIRSGVQQLVSKDPDRAFFHVIWIHCEGYDANLHELQFHATIYGTQKLVSIGHPQVITAYYFLNSSFHRYRLDLDAVILSNGQEARMLLNDHSPRFASIKQSKLALVIGVGVFFPQQYGLSEDVMICDHPNNRDCESQSLDYLRSKYGLEHLQTMDMGMYEGVAAPTTIQNYGGK